MANNANSHDNSHNDASSATTQGCTQAAPDDLAHFIHLLLSDEDQRPPLKDCTQANISLVPEDPGFCIRRFLFGQEQNMSAGMRQTLSEAKAEAIMTVLLHAFDTKLGNFFIDNSSARK